MNLHPYTACSYAAMLGVDRDEIDRLHALDPRILAAPALETEHAVRRLRRWLAAGRPDGDDLALLAYRGSARVRRLLVEVVGALPPPARRLAVVHVTWREVGDRESGRFGASLPRRAFDAELAGGEPDEIVRYIAAHETAHGLHHALDEEAPPPPDLDGPRPDTVDLLAARVRVARQIGITEERLSDERAFWISRRVASETRADRQAAAWGIPCRMQNEDELRRMFAAQFDEARRLAALAEEGEAA